MARRRGAGTRAARCTSFATGACRAPTTITLHASSRVPLGAPVPRPGGVQALARRAARRRPVRGARSCFVCAPAASTATAPRCRAGRSAAGRDDRRRGVGRAATRARPARRAAHGVGAPVMRRLSARRCVARACCGRSRRLRSGRLLRRRACRRADPPGARSPSTPSASRRSRRRVGARARTAAARLRRPRADPRKNVTLLLDAFVRLRARMPRVRLTLVGGLPTHPCPTASTCSAKSSRSPSRSAAARCSCSPSRQEGFGIVVAEALAAGVPAIVTPSGGPEEIVRESGGGRGAPRLSTRTSWPTASSALLGDRDRLREHAPPRPRLRRPPSTTRRASRRLLARRSRSSMR